MGPGPLLLHAEGDARTGLGHLVRMVAVAGELASSRPVALASASPHLEPLVQELSPWARGAFQVHALPRSERSPWDRGLELGARVSALAEELEAYALVSDGKATFPEAALGQARTRGPVVLVDNVETNPGAYDVLVLPTCHADPEVLTRVGTSKVATGPAWTFLHPAVPGLVEAPQRSRLGIFVSMGGADPQGLTLRAVRHLLEQGEERIVAVVGPANQQRGALQALADRDHRLSLVHGSPSSQQALAASARALCAFGITAYEAVALGVPLQVVPHTGPIDGDIRRFAAAFPGRVRASPAPEELGKWPELPEEPTPQLGGLGRGLDELTSRGTPRL